jgi:hypothetical protein
MPSAPPATLAEDRTSLELPPRLDLPLFAYGLLKPGEPAHASLVGEAVGQTWTARLPEAGLRQRDGLPLLDPDAGGGVEGFLMRFRSGHEHAAYAAIGAFAPRHHYRWLTVEAVLDNGETMLANTLRGRRPRRGGVNEAFPSWSAAAEPVLRYGLHAVRSAALEHGATPFPTLTSDSAAMWERFFSLQAAFHLLWAALDRFTALAVGPGDAPLARLDRLNDDDHWKASTRAAVGPGLTVADGRDPQRTKRIKDDGGGAVYSWQPVRTSLGYPGRGAFAEGVLVRRALVELHDTFRLHLLGRLPALEPAWEALDPEGAAHRWLLCPVVSPDGLG